MATFDTDVLGGGAGGFTSAVGEQEATKIGVRAIYRAGGADSDLDPVLDGEYAFMALLYLTYQF